MLVTFEFIVYIYLFLYLLSYRYEKGKKLDITLIFELSSDKRRLLHIQWWDKENNRHKTLECTYQS